MENFVITNSSGVFSTLIGFFSWLSVCEDNNIKLHFHTTNKTGIYDEKYLVGNLVSSKDLPKNFLDKNFYLEFFEQSEILNEKYPEEYLFTHLYPSDINEIKIPSCLSKYCGKGFYKELYQDLTVLSEVRSLYNRSWLKFKLNKSFLKKINLEEKLLSNKTLCAMVRTSLHYDGYGHRPQQMLESIINDVKSKMDSYDSILVTTQVQPFVDEFVKVFGDRCIVPERPKRLDGDIDWIGVNQTMSHEDYLEEIEYCLMDVILSSKCDHIIGSSSNMFLGALSMNPVVDFSLFSNLIHFNGL